MSKPVNKVQKRQIKLVHKSTTKSTTNNRIQQQSSTNKIDSDYYIISEYKETPTQVFAQLNNTIPEETNEYLEPDSDTEIAAEFAEFVVSDYEVVFPPAKRTKHSDQVDDTRFDYEVDVLAPSETNNQSEDDQNIAEFSLDSSSIPEILRDIGTTLLQINSKVSNLDRTLNSKLNFLTERVNNIETLLGVNARQLTAIRQEVRSTTQGNPPDAVVMTYDLLPPLPLRTEEMLESLEQDCLMNEEVATQLRHKVASIGGKDLSSCARRVMHSIFTNQSTMRYTWFGLKNNICIQNYKIMQIIIETIAAECKGTKNEAETVIKRWLHYTKDRERRLHQPKLLGTKGIGF